MFTHPFTFCAFPNHRTFLCPGNFWRSSPWARDFRLTMFVQIGHKRLLGPSDLNGFSHRRQGRIVAFGRGGRPHVARSSSMSRFSFGAYSLLLFSNRFRAPFFLHSRHRPNLRPTGNATPQTEHFGCLATPTLNLLFAFSLLVLDLLLALIRIV